MSISKQYWWGLAGTATLLTAWEIGSRLSGSHLIFPGPALVARRFVGLLQTARFYRALGGSFLRVLAGILLSVPLGTALGILAGLDKRIGAFLSPLFGVIAAAPVQPVILIAFLMFGSERTPVFVAFLMIFPVTASTAIAAVRSVDPKLRELFALYRISRQETIRRLYVPAIAPFFLGGLHSSLSLCWKVVVAAEVLVQPLLALGTGMQRAKAQLETPELFAWTLATIIAAAITKMVSLALLRLRGRRRPLS